MRYIDRMIEDGLFEGLQIRDVLVHTSVVVKCYGYALKTFIVENDLDVEVKIYVQGSRDKAFSKILSLERFTVGKNKNDYETLSDYLPYVRIIAQCERAPLSGSLSVYLERVLA